MINREMEELIQEDNENKPSSEFNIRQLNEAVELIELENQIPFEEFL
jgi:hypothetical protein